MDNSETEVSGKKIRKIVLHLEGSPEGIARLHDAIKNRDPELMETLKAHDVIDIDGFRVGEDD